MQSQCIYLRSAAQATRRIGYDFPLPQRWRPNAFGQLYSHVCMESVKARLTTATWLSHSIPTISLLRRPTSPGQARGGC